MERRNIPPLKPGDKHSIFEWARLRALTDEDATRLHGKFLLDRADLWANRDCPVDKGFSEFDRSFYADVYGIEVGKKQISDFGDQEISGFR